MTVSLLQAIKSAGRQTAFAMLFLFICLVSLEWLLPGSVLPFIDLIDFLPLVLAVSFTVLIFIEHGSAFSRIAQGIFGFILGGVLLAVLYFNLQYVSIRTVTLLISGGICVFIWVYAINSKD